MAHKRSQKQILNNVLIDGRLMENLTPLTALNTNLNIHRNLGPLLVLDVSAEDLPVTITDSGGANGGVGSLLVGMLPDTQIHVFDGILAMEVVSVGAGISATGSVNSAVGTTAASVAVLSGTAANLIASATATLTGGAGTSRALTTIVGVQLNATGGSTGLYINFGVPDASITATADIVVSFTARLLIGDVSRGL